MVDGKNQLGTFKVKEGFVYFSRHRITFIIKNKLCCVTLGIFITVFSGVMI